MSYLKELKEYENVEQQAHIFNSSSIVNKATQEYFELKQAKHEDNLQEMVKETRDLIVNILSSTAKTGVLPEEKRMIKILSVTDEQFDKAYAGWNEAIQGYNQDYSREIVSAKDLQFKTERLVSNALTYGNLNENIADILKFNTAKFKGRLDKYRPQINIDDYVDNVRFKGVPFKDIKKLLLNPDVMKFVCWELAMKCKNADVIAGFDARGFIFASVIAQMLRKPLVMVRKPDKLPGEVMDVEYTLEYEKDIPHHLQMQVGGLQPGQSVALIDDVLATGGTMKGGAKLVKGLGGNVDVMAAVLGLDYLERQNEISGYNVQALRSYSEPANV